MGQCETRLCKNCLRWYFTRANQCDVPYRQTDNHFAKAVHGDSYHKIDKVGNEFLKSHQKFINTRDHKKAFGHPSELNANNDCYFYIGLPRWLRWTTPIVRFVYQCFGG